MDTQGSIDKLFPFCSEIGLQTLNIGESVVEGELLTCLQLFRRPKLDARTIRHRCLHPPTMLIKDGNRRRLTVAHPRCHVAALGAVVDESRPVGASASIRRIDVAAIAD